MTEYRNLPSIDRPWLHGFGSGGIEDSHGRWWRNYRANYWLAFGPTVDEREQERRWNVHVGGQWVHLSKILRRVGLKVSTTGEKTLDVHVYGGPLFTHYWDVTVERFAAMGEKHGRQFPRRRELRLPPVRFVVEVGLTGMDWCFGPDDDSWSSSAPLSDRLRRGRVTWWRYSKAYRRGDAETIATTMATVPLPEAGYEVDVKLERVPALCAAVDRLSGLLDRCETALAYIAQPTTGAGYDAAREARALLAELRAAPADETTP